MSERPRVKNQYSLFEEAHDVGRHQHQWRTIECDGSDWDTIECSKCGKQRRARCNFDEEYE